MYFITVSFSLQQRSPLDPCIVEVAGTLRSLCAVTSHAVVVVIQL